MKEWKYIKGRKPLREAERVVCWFSCGVTSAVATKIALETFKDSGIPIVIAYCDTGSEPEDNARFLKDCQQWFGQEITILKSEKYSDIWDVFNKTGYLVGNGGARCTAELKKSVRYKFEKVDTDIQVFGFDADELERVNKWQKNNFECCIHAPLIDRFLSKDDCKNIVINAGIGLPDAYEHFDHANCIGCVKAANFTYWNKIRVVHPDVFERMSTLERKLNVTVNKKYKITPVNVEMFALSEDGMIQVQNEDCRKVEYTKGLQAFIDSVTTLEQVKKHTGLDGLVSDKNNKQLNYKKRIRLFLDELDPTAGSNEPMKPIQCGLFCDDILDVMHE